STQQRHAHSIRQARQSRNKLFLINRCRSYLLAAYNDNRDALTVPVEKGWAVFDMYEFLFKWDYLSSALQDVLRLLAQSTVLLDVEGHSHIAGSPSGAIDLSLRSTLRRAGAGPRGGVRSR